MINDLRLLPWTSPDGKACFLSTAGPDSKLSQIADEVEEAITDEALEVFEGVQALLGDTGTDAHHLRVALVQAAGSLDAMIRIAEVRRDQLVRYTRKDNDGVGDEPQLQADAFG
ncbi:hypothetical protein HUT18_14350 [Streptomyces sp. NA04227]|uniref:hypothetical protein n=1 Tax=Streptomyces sp. NA04227 TaxID=2742136 RepID=UPI0015921057|nr:hypothetical protein [Streptomyces sp. NA04227]QKW07391.1 hypothetical protein HUT18_14350 [Streptomyces sp. NA04227]